MLNRLVIKNYALIENLDIHFDKGLNMITGETGAGKSIIMGALGLILGQRAEGKPFFNADQKCVIEAYFAIEPYGLHDFFKTHDLDYDAQSIIRREITVDGRSRAFVNDVPVTLHVLKSFGEQLIDIHSQHATLQLNTESFQLLVMDSVADNAALQAVYKKSFQQYKQRKQQVLQLQEELAQYYSELDFNTFLFEELDKAKLDEIDQQLLEDELRQQENAEDIKRGLTSATFLLAEQEQPLTQSLKEVIASLQSVESFMPALSEAIQRLQSTWIEIKDVAAELSNMDHLVQLSGERLTFLQERLSEVYSLQKKHRVDSVAQLIALRESLALKINAVNQQEDLIATLTLQMEIDKVALQDAAQHLHRSRLQVQTQVQEQVEAVLFAVGMPNARLLIDMKERDLPHFAANGSTAIAFLFSANKGQDPQAIAKVASGGELSRVMLAIKTLIAQQSALPTIIFDEIDTGISGEVALQVGQVMERLAQNMQVLAITHLPQIAAKGRAHYKVFKQDDNERTRTHIIALKPEQRIVEIAQMLSGAQPGASALQHAQELLHMN